MQLGVTATLKDYDIMRALGADFIELLVLRDDDIADIEMLIRRHDQELIIHVPEKISVDGRTVMLDLAADDDTVREHSILRVNEISETAARYGVPLVIHPGGVRTEKVDPRPLIKRLIRSLNSLEGRLWIENMPRRYHHSEDLWFCNLLLAPHEFDEVLPFVEGVTLDISHAYLSVDLGGNSAIARFFEHLMPSIKHVHLSDARYPHGEGLRLGHGDVDLCSLPHLDDLPVLLEVWSGHENGGAWFKEALDKVRSDGTMFHGCIPREVKHQGKSE